MLKKFVVLSSSQSEFIVCDVILYARHINMGATLGYGVGSGCGHS